MNIKRLLFIGFSIIIFLVSLAAFITYQMARDSSHTFNTALNEQYEKQNLILKMQFPARSYTLHIQQAILAQDEFDRDEMIMLAYHFGRTYDERRADFMKVMNANDVKWLTGLDFITTRVNAATTEILKVLSEGDVEKSASLVHKRVFPLTREFEVYVKSYADGQEAIFKEKLAQEDVLLDELVHKVVIISLFVILISMGIAWLVGRRIQSLADELLALNGTLEQRVEVRTQALKRTQEKLIKKNKHLKQVSREDALTGTLNRLGVREILHTQLERFRGAQEDFCVMFIDVDFFKNINDMHGHEAGDEVLMSVTATILKILPEKCAIGRWGGEEFLIVCPGKIDQAVALAEMVRQAVSALQYRGGNQVTISLGLAQVNGNELMDDLLKRADKALYKAKSEGRNRAVVAA